MKYPWSQREKNLSISHQIIQKKNTTFPYHFHNLNRHFKSLTTQLNDIHYKLVSNLPESSLFLLLTVFNSIWEARMFPPSWREATVVASQELGKASTDPNNYRPIALTSCLCKTMERMLNNWLMWVPECKGLLASDQCGFISLGSLQIIWFVLIVTFVTLLLPPPPQITCYWHFLWSGKSLHHVEARYTIWSLRT